jgi:maltose-binding protein MalE
MNPGPVVYRDYLVAAQDIPALNESLKAGAWSQATNNTEYKGKIYGLNAEAPLGYIRSFLLYNKDYAKQYGIEDMYALVKDNKWTFDKFLEVSEKVYDQSGGKVSSIVTRYGMPKALLEQFMTSNDAVPFTQKDGKLVTQINTEKGIRACQFVVDMIGKKLIDMDYINNPGDPYDYFIAGNSMFYIAQGWEIGDIGEELPSDFGILPMPMGPDATSYASYYDQIRIYSIVDNGDGGEAAAHVLLALKKRQADTYLDIEDAAEPYNWLEDLAYDASDDESLEMADLINNSLSMNYIVLLSEVPGWDDAAAQIAGGVSTPAEAIGAISAQLQAAVDEANK